MSFVPNSYQQISLFDKLAFLSQRKQRMLEKSWAQAFSNHIFTRINEHIFAPLYSEKMNSRPNAPINVLVGALILKDFTNLTDKELTEACEFDFRYQYALHTTSFEDQPVSERTLSRFRSRLAAYELTTGEDLLHQCFIEMADGLRQYMDISPAIKRMDSMMIESNIRKMGRLELLYTCLANLVKELHRDGKLELLEGLEHYADPNDRNRVVYHDQDTPQSDRLQKASMMPVPSFPNVEKTMRIPKTTSCWKELSGSRQRGTRAVVTFQRAKGMVWIPRRCKTLQTRMPHIGRKPGKNIGAMRRISRKPLM